ncbi:MAG: hypothetical protein ACLPX8_02200 [Bryobacteraceae bacterium]|jgi:hypothetical protein
MAAFGFKIISTTLFHDVIVNRNRGFFEIAEGQEGFFTTKQAKAAGFAENTHLYYVQVGN